MCKSLGSVSLVMFVSATYANVFFFFFFLSASFSSLACRNLFFIFITAHIGVHHVRSAPLSINLLGSLSNTPPPWRCSSSSLRLGIIFFGKYAAIISYVFVTAPAVLYWLAGLYPPDTRTLYYFPCPNFLVPSKGYPFRSRMGFLCFSWVMPLHELE